MKIKNRSLTALPVLALCAPAVATAQSGDARPNILVVVTDDQRWDAIGVAGNKVIETPTLDRLAKKGLYAPQATVTTPISCASRAATLTGQFARHNGVYDFFTRINLETTYPAIMREEGYYTGFIGKWGTLETSDDYFADAANTFDYWGGSMYQSNYWHERDCNYVVNNGTSDKLSFRCDCPDDGKGHVGEEIRTGRLNIDDPVHQDTYVIPKKVTDFLDARETAGNDKPFCLSISYKGPHGPWSDFDEIYKQLYAGVSMPIRDNVDLENAQSQPPFLRVSLNGTAMGKLKSKDNINGPLHNSMRQYYRLINGVDDSLNKILKELKKRGLDENTVVIFIGDNGQFHAEHGFDGKWLMYEESIRVPFFIYDPRVKRGGGVSDEFIQNIDIAPTVLDLAGIKIPDSMDGKSLVELYKKPDMKFRGECYSEHHFKNGEGATHIERSECYKDHKWKYIKYIDRQGDNAEQLYNLESDPYEMQNLALDAKYAKVMKEYREKYANYFNK